MGETPVDHDIGPDEIPEDDPREPAGPPPGRRTRVWVLFLAILGVIVVLALSAWMAMDGGDDAPVDDVRNTRGGAAAMV